MKWANKPLTCACVTLSDWAEKENPRRGVGALRRGRGRLARFTRISRIEARISRMWSREEVAFGKSRSVAEIKKIRVIRV
ncbi:hypothetical protein [Azospirillum palustre]